MSSPIVYAWTYKMIKKAINFTIGMQTRNIRWYMACLGMIDWIKSSSISWISIVQSQKQYNRAARFWLIEYLWILNLRKNTARLISFEMHAA